MKSCVLLVSLIIVAAPVPLPGKTSIECIIPYFGTDPFCKISAAYTIYIYKYDKKECHVKFHVCYYDLKLLKNDEDCRVMCERMKNFTLARFNKTYTEH